MDAESSTSNILIFLSDTTRPQCDACCHLTVFATVQYGQLYLVGQYSRKFQACFAGLPYPRNAAFLNISGLLKRYYRMAGRWIGTLEGEADTGKDI
jgi:hypothetical protein